MNKSEALNFVNILKQTYPDAQCSLDFNTPFQLAVAVMLSAQCTDERVNKTTPILFKKCKTIDDFKNIDINELEIDTTTKPERAKKASSGGNKSVAKKTSKKVSIFDIFGL